MMQVMEKKWLWMLKGNVCKAKKEGGSGEWLVAIPLEATKNERARRVHILEEKDTAVTAPIRLA